MAEASGDPEFTTLQSLIWPEPGICTEPDLYLRLHGAAGISHSRREIRLDACGMVASDTWFNLFNIGKWTRHCTLGDLYLTLQGAGRFEVSICLAGPHHSGERQSEIIALPGDGRIRLDLAEGLGGAGEKGILHFEIKSLGDGVLTGAAWQTTTAPRRIPSLAVAITTFRREAAVARTIERFNRDIGASPLRDHIRLIVTDNGQSLEPAETARVAVVANRNLGGAGGFARGLIEARERGASHCVFMDDDASLHMASLERTWRFLAHADDPATAVAGAMINARYRWSIWENGAVFDLRCRPLYMGTDLRDAAQAFAMEFDTTAPAPANFYGGWWYFAFPLDHAQHMPFPFFVRGDDVSFSLVHDFNTVTLNGVVSFQESFTDKESPLTWYLDLRSHMAHHLALPELRAGRLRTLKIAAWFFARNLPRMHYETLAAINLALEDVLAGPAFFDENADMSARRADIRALTRVESWGPAPARSAPDKGWINPENRWARGIMKATLNGHLLPFFRLWGNRITLPAPDRGRLRRSWGAARITYLSADRRQCYTVRHSKLALLRQSARFIVAALRFLLRYDRLLAQWQSGYGDLTTESYWRQKLRLPGPGGRP